MPDLLIGVPVPLLLLAVVVVLTVEGGLPIGAFVPGTTVAFGTGALAGPEGWPAAAVAVAAGAVAGGQLGFRLGRRRRVRETPFAGTARLPHGPWRRAGRAVADHPTIAIGVGQWATWGRVVVPRVAGWASVPAPRFGVVQGGSAVAWAVVLTGVGSLAGDPVRENVTLALGLLLIVVGTILVTGRRDARVAPRSAGRGRLAGGRVR